MPNFITLLLKKDPTAHQEALSLFEKAIQHAKQKAKNKAKKEIEKNHSPLVPTETQIAIALEKPLRQSLSHLNLCDPALYQTLYQAIHRWQPQLISENLKKQQQCGLIQNTLLSLLPKIRQDQQKQQLETACAAYQTYLKTIIETEMDKRCPPRPYTHQIRADLAVHTAHEVTNHPDDYVVIYGRDVDSFAMSQPPLADYPRPLRLAIEKYQAVSTLHQTLQTQKPVEAQLKAFHQVYETRRELIEKNRDSAATTFLKVIATVFTVGLAAVCGIFSSKGKQTSDHIQRTLASGSVEVLDQPVCST